jgi:cellobiose epimerase
MINVSVHSKTETFREELYAELTGNILPYWMNTMVDETYGGFYGRRNGLDELVPQADKGVILNTRILWTFSHAYQKVKNSPDQERYRETASRAYEYLIQNFMDHENGGVYWMVNFKGDPVYTKKQIYAQAFAIYALTEYHLATQNKQALDHAITIFRLIEKHSFDPIHGGYYEAFDHDWKLLADQRLSDKDANESKTMNTHLHVLEAYTNLHRCWKNSLVERQLSRLILIFLDKIIDQKNHLQLFFDEKWNVKSSVVSFGHDIEASWLLVEAAAELGDKALLERVQAKSLQLVKAVESEGLSTDGAVFNEIMEDGSLDKDIHWWQQAEAMVGFFQAWELTGDESYLKKVRALWLFIQQHVVDRKHGEWLWLLKDNYSIDAKEDKAGPWKCPYHNGRACMELIQRLKP